MRSMTPQQAQHALRGGEEVALLDVREALPHGFGHPLMAVHAPLSRLELVVEKLVPRKATPVLLFDDDDGRSELASARLAALGYDSPVVIAGGSKGWVAAGESLFPEQQAFTKAFGAFAEHWGKPQFIAPTELAVRKARGDAMVLLDARPPDEYERGNIPGSIDAPGPDVLYCFDDLVLDRHTPVVVNCMSRTRGILAGLTLREAGVSNPVFVLEDGTRNWLLHGYELEQGADRFSIAPSVQAKTRAQSRAGALARKAHVQSINWQTLNEWMTDRERTTYVIDVRTANEFFEGHIDGARNVAYGSLYMHPDHDIGTLNARVVIVDNDGVRATVTAMWMRHLGWPAVTFRLNNEVPQVIGHSLQGPSLIPEVELITADELRRASLPIVDVDASVQFVANHIDGAMWCDRPRLSAFVRQRLADHDRIVVTSTDGVLARYAVADDDNSTSPQRFALAGGTHEWSASGGAMTSGESGIEMSREDHWLWSSERPGDVTTNVKAYLEWETRLVGDVERAGPVPYRNLLWAPGTSSGTAGPR